MVRYCENLLATSAKARVALEDGHTWHRIDRDLGCFCWEGFDRVIHRWLEVHVPSSCAISCGDFETIF